MVETVSLLMPSMIIFFSAIDTLATYGAASYIMKRPDGRAPALPGFGTWRFPGIFWALVAGGDNGPGRQSIPR